MGTWGVGLFSDDTALDVKGEWEELYKRFGEPEQTTREVLEIFDADDEDVGPAVVLALAMCQWKYGCLQPEIKARALGVIRTGAGLHMWEDPKDLAKRQAVYARLAEALERPQPPRRRIGKLTPLEVTPYREGQLLKYRCWDGEYLLLWVRGVYRYKGDVLPLCAALDWKGRTLPSRGEVLALRPVICSVDAFSKQWARDYAARTGETLPPEPEGQDWTGYAPREPSAYGFDASRIEVVPGEWQWDLREKGRGPQVPRWIEVGPVIAGDLSTTLASYRTIERVEGGWRRPVVPKHPRPLAPRLAPARPLGVDIALPRGRATRRSDLLSLKRTKHQPVPGDIVVVNVKGQRWAVGRVILADAHFSCGPADILVYFYRQSFGSTSEIMLPMGLDDLAIAPCAAHHMHWECGEFLPVAHVPLERCELPVRHIFGPDGRGYYRDAYGMPARPPADDELVGDMGVGVIGARLATALGVG
jgi:hypothetical protein